jgi:hypothetical protein
MDVTRKWTKNLLKTNSFFLFLNYASCPRWQQNLSSTLQQTNFLEPAERSRTLAASRLLCSIWRYTTPDQISSLQIVSERHGEWFASPLLCRRWWISRSDHWALRPAVCNYGMKHQSFPSIQAQAFAVTIISSNQIHTCLTSLGVDPRLKKKDKKIHDKSFQCHRTVPPDNSHSSEINSLNLVSQHGSLKF